MRSCINRITLSHTYTLLLLRIHINLKSRQIDNIGINIYYIYQLYSYRYFSVTCRSQFSSLKLISKCRCNNYYPSEIIKMHVSLSEYINFLDLQASGFAELVTSSATTSFVSPRSSFHHGFVAIMQQSIHN